VLYELDGVCVETPPTGEFWVAPSAIVVGRVKLERDVSIWFGSVLRGDTELIHIKERSNVQDGCVLHTDAGFPLTVGQGCVIGHRATLHGCTIGANCLVGIGASVLNGCRIGNNCIIGAHTLLPEGKEIPAGALVMGVPGRVVRDVTAQEIATLTEFGADWYAQNWKRFAKGMRAMEDAKTSDDPEA
jgi:carbonic anhydrase/acetyltransferase-like protein (isoleucine patch superfamily)